MVSWSMNWPMKVVPAEWLGLFGLPALRAGSVMSLTGRWPRESLASSTARLAELHERGFNVRALRRERWQIEHPAETVVRVGLAGRRCLDHIGPPEADRGCPSDTECAQKSSTGNTNPPGIALAFVHAMAPLDRCQRTVSERCKRTLLERR